MTSSTRQVRTPIAILVSLVLALLLFATTGVSRAQAQTYNLETFNCGGGHNSGSYDSNGNLYIPCSTADNPNIKNAGVADKGAPSLIRVFSPEGALLKTITIPQNTDLDTTNNHFVYDVAPSKTPPNTTASVLYLTSVTSGVVNPVKKLTVNDAGTSGTLSQFASQTAWKLTTDVDNGFVYISDNPSKKVYKYNDAGRLTTSFDARPSGGGDIGGIAVNHDGSVLYVSQMNGNPTGLPNKVNRFNSADGTSYTHDAARTVGGNYDENNPCATDLYNDPANTPVPSWIGYFAYSWDIGLDAQENLYALSTTCHEVHKFRPDGSWVMGLKVNEEDRFSTVYADNGRPHGVAVAMNGEVYIGEASEKMDLPNEPGEAPDTSITGGPAQGSTTPDTTASFSFSADPAAGATFECKLDAANFTECASPKEYNNLSATEHTFSVRAKNANGTDDTPATRTWTVTNDDDVSGTCRGEANTKMGSNDPALPDNLTGRAGIRDVIGARSGADTISNLDNTDLACGGTEEDTFTRFGGSVVVDGAGDGDAAGDNASDTIDFSWITTPDINGRGAFIKLSGTSDRQTAEGVVFEVTSFNVADATGSPIVDTMRGDHMRNTLKGGAGNDTISGGAEAAGAGGDWIEGEAGSDTIDVRDGSIDTVICGESANDWDTVKADALDEMPNKDCERVDLPPRVLGTTPLAGATDVAPTASVTARFSEGMNANTLRSPTTKRSTTFTLVRKNPDGTKTAVLAKVSYSVTTTSTGAKVYKATLDPDANLQPGKTYVATVTSEAKDVVGEALDQNPRVAGNQSKVWSFRVKL